MNTKDIAINSKAKFIRYQQGVAYYAVTVPYSEMLYSFPVPLDTMDGEVLTAENNTIYFMDYIRKAIHDGTLTKEAA